MLFFDFLEHILDLMADFISYIILMTFWLFVKKNYWILFASMRYFKFLYSKLYSPYTKNWLFYHNFVVWTTQNYHYFGSPAPYKFKPPLFRSFIFTIILWMCSSFVHLMEPWSLGYPHGRQIDKYFPIHLRVFKKSKI